MGTCSRSRPARAGGVVAALALLLAAPDMAEAQMQLEAGLGAAIPTVDLGNTTKPGPFANGLVGLLAHSQVTINAQVSGSWFSGKTVFQSGQSAGKEADIAFYTYGIGVDVNGLDRFHDWMLLFQGGVGATTLDVGPCDAPCTTAVNQGVARIEGGTETDFTFWGGFQAMYKLNRSWAIGGGVRYYVVFASGPNLTSLPLAAFVRWTAGQ
jgi:hypothetical protein